MVNNRERNWCDLRAWLNGRDGEWFVDAAVLGGLPRYEAEEVLVDFGLDAAPENLRHLARLVDEAL